MSDFDIPPVVTREWAERLGLDFEDYKAAPKFVHSAIEYCVLRAANKAPTLDAKSKRKLRKQEREVEAWELADEKFGLAASRARAELAWPNPHVDWLKEMLENTTKEEKSNE
jgi:hypothetical protein